MLKIIGFFVWFVFNFVIFIGWAKRTNTCFDTKWEKVGLIFFSCMGIPFLILVKLFFDFFKELV